MKSVHWYYSKYSWIIMSWWSESYVMYNWSWMEKLTKLAPKLDHSCVVFLMSCQAVFRLAWSAACRDRSKEKEEVCTTDDSSNRGSVCLLPFNLYIILTVLYTRQSALSHCHTHTVTHTVTLTLSHSHCHTHTVTLILSHSHACTVYITTMHHRSPSHLNHCPVHWPPRM